MSELVVGLFVGGRARRLGGAPKGLLASPSGPPIVERSAQLAESFGARVVLVGYHEAYSAWCTARGIRTLADEGTNLGPLGGVLALLRAAPAHAIALACDMPYVGRDLMRRLIEAPPATIVAPRRDGRWEPFFARYDAAGAEPIARELAAQGRTALWELFDTAGAQELLLQDGDGPQLVDWDQPGDLG